MRFGNFGTQQSGSHSSESIIRVLLVRLVCVPFRVAVGLRVVQLQHDSQIMILGTECLKQYYDTEGSFDVMKLGPTSRA